MSENSQDPSQADNIEIAKEMDSRTINESDVNEPIDDFQPEPEPPYSILTKREKYYLSLLIAMSGVWSTLSTSIYFPALSILSKDFVVSSAITNISVVAYLLFQGIAPTLVAPIADAFGRRPMTIACLLCYCAVCIGLARTNVYWLLVVLRLFQSASIAPIISVSTGVVGDICPRAERGSFIGIVSGIQLVGQGFGALVGAGVVSRFGWRGIFYLLAIGSGFVLTLVLLLLPETNRLIVGNMSVPPTSFFNKLPITHIPSLSKRLTNDTATKTKSNVKLSSIISPFKIFFQFKVFFILLPSGILFASWTMALTTFSTALADRYGYTIVHVGLCYLAPGMGALIGALVSGRILNYIYKLKKDKHEEDLRNLPKEEVKPFNIYKTRLHVCLIPSLISCASYVVFGWCIQYKVNIAPALVFSFIFSFCAVTVMSAVMTLLVDLFPNQSSAGISCVNLMRCLLGAAGVGALQSMVDAMGEGGCYTLMAGFSLIGTIILYFIVEYESKKILENGDNENTPDS